MTISPLMIYLIDVCHSLCVLTNVVFFLSVAFIGGTVTLNHTFDWEEIKESVEHGVLKWALVVFAVSAMGCLLIPSKNTLIQMLVIPPIVNNEQIQELPVNVLNFVNDYLKQIEREKDL